MPTLEQIITEVRHIFKKINELTTLTTLNGTEMMAVSRSENGSFVEYQLDPRTLLNKANIPSRYKRVEIDFDAAGSLASKFVSAINALPLYALSNYAVHYFYADRLVLTNGESPIQIDQTLAEQGYTVIRHYFVLKDERTLTSGVAYIGTGTTPIGTGGIVELAPVDYRLNTPNEYDLGDIGASTVYNFINGNATTYAVPNSTVNLFKGTQNSEDKYWLYTGAAESIGNGLNNSDYANSNFVEFTTDNAVTTGGIPGADQILVDGYLSGYAARQNDTTVDGHLRGISNQLNHICNNFLGLDIDFDVTNLAYQSNITSLLNSGSSRINGKSYYVNNASADPDVTSGAAIYKYIGTTGVQGSVTLAGAYERFTYTASGEVNTINTTTTGEPSGSDLVLNVVSLTQAEYDAGTPVSTTFYIITDA